MAIAPEVPDLAPVQRRYLQTACQPGRTERTGWEGSTSSGGPWAASAAVRADLSARC